MMTNDKHGYKYLSKRKLVELLVEENKKTEELERQLNIANKELASRELILNEVGSIAEASLALNGVFEAAQASYTQYIENIKKGVPCKIKSMQIVMPKAESKLSGLLLRQGRGRMT